ncbi:type IV toxin-antitoxin system AbiEi family antitoxin [Paraburkholderia sediminicola]|jgi:hypothetical protein|uniref:type IV toxin-antitoxin system AbiEi family antitoxin n=1 Tax=Paraburkholderia sediminicola TaxID=458836 RepID=UPI0038B78647
MDAIPAMALVDRFVQAFEAATGATIADARGSEIPFRRPEGIRRLDLLLHAQTAHRELDLAVELISQAYPRDIRHTVWQLEEYLLSTERRNSTIPFVVAEYLSTGARESLRERGIGYFDSSGSLFLKNGDWLVNIDRPGKPKKSPRVGSIFAGAREQVVHALLHAGDKWLTGLEIAELAQTSSYTVSQTLRELERLEWTVSEGSGRNQRRRLVQPGKLLDAWVESWRTREETKTRWYMFAPSPQSAVPWIYNVFGNTKRDDWTVTGASAANALSPLLTSVDTVDLIVPPGSAAQYAKDIGLKEVAKGANVTLLERAGASTLFRHHANDVHVWFASPFILYLDLLDGRGRNKELASEFRSSILKI